MSSEILDAKRGVVVSKRPAVDEMLYRVAVLVGAFLMFQVQPLIAKVILPWFGGSALVWTACLLFFQMALLGGYAGACWLSRQPATRQKVVYLCLLALSLLSLPVLPSERWKPGPYDDPLLRIIGLLAATVGPTYFLLCASSPLLQSWRSHCEAIGTYRLFAFSNAGSLVGLLTYPVLIEPRLTIREQAWTWSIVYSCSAVIFAVIALRHARMSAAHATAESAIPPGLALRFLWIALAASASALLLAMTNHLTQSISPVPFLWILPLSLYLLSLILCFDSDRWYRRPLFALLGCVSLAVISFAISSANNIREPKMAIAAVCVPLFVLFMLCHGELARRSPTPAYLTTFYLMLAAGGAAGGLLIGFGAPYLLNGLYEPIIILILTTPLLVLALRPERMLGRTKDLTVIALLIAYCVLLFEKSPGIASLSAGTLALWVFRTARGKEQMALYALAVGLVAGIGGGLVQDTLKVNAGSRMLARNFYGAIEVYDQPSDGAMGPVRVLRHGSIAHGDQFLEPQYQHHATTYYARQSGVGLALETLMPQGPLNIGVIGLGAGTLAAYARPGDRYAFYEIDPNVIAIAHSEFTFLRGSEAPLDIIRGDARLSLEREPNRNFDLLAVDAFSGDSIPVHLLTREAFELYWRHLKPDGVLALHITNRYLALAPVAAVGAIKNHKQARIVKYRGDSEQSESPSDWVLVTSRPSFLDLEAIRVVALPIQVPAGLRPWTDDFSNLYEVLR